MQVVDEKHGKNAVKKAFIREEIYRGPYTVNAPDVVVGYAVGYRVSWESAVNYVGEELFSDNTRMWSGDHAFTRDQIPGVFFCNRKIGGKGPGADRHLADRAGRLRHRQTRLHRGPRPENRLSGFPD